MWINRENILWIILIRQQRSGKWHNFSSDANRNQSLVRRLSEPKQSETTSVKCKAHDTIRFLYFKNRLYSSCFETIFFRVQYSYSRIFVECLVFVFLIFHVFCDTVDRPKFIVFDETIESMFVVLHFKNNRPSPWLSRGWNSLFRFCF